MISNNFQPKNPKRPEKTVEPNSGIKPRSISETCRIFFPKPMKTKAMKRANANPIKGKFQSKG